MNHAITYHNAPYRRWMSVSALETHDRMLADQEIAGATDPMTLTLLAAMMTTIQPRRVLQLGTYIGFSLIVLADLLAHNRRPGRVVAVDPSEPHLRKATKYAQKAGFNNIDFLIGASTQNETVRTLRRMALADRDQSAGYGVIYLDASHACAETREELDIYPALLSEGGVMLLHDASDQAREFDPTRSGGVREALLNWWATARHAGYFLLVLEPPVWSFQGCALISRQKLPGNCAECA